MVRRKLAPSRTAAQAAIAAGEVQVAGVAASKSSTLVDDKVSIRIRPETGRFVGRGGLKLEAGLEASGIDVTGKRALDVGASTGGFTDCLLQRGASHVVALDVGYGQLDWLLRNDDRVEVIERTNFRHVDPETIGAPFDVIVADLSFISLALVAPQLRACGAESCDYVLLVKPQFEVGKEDVGSGGIVREPVLHVAAIESVSVALASSGIGVVGAVPSPVTGAKGNREFLVWGRPGPRTLSGEQIHEVAAQ